MNSFFAFSLQKPIDKKRQLVLELVCVVTLLLLFSLLIYLLHGDKGLSQMIFAKNQSWPGIEQFPWNFLYTWAPAPGFFMAGAAVVALVAGFFSPRLQGTRRPAIFLLLVLAVGPGLLVNVLLKDQLGRARPREIIECGGTHNYTEFWEKGTTGANSSFPSGHASVAFFTLTPWFILRNKHRRSAVAFLVIGTGFGVTVGIARMLQGGHYLSDVLWAGGIVYLTGSLFTLILPFAGEDNALIRTDVENSN